MTTEQTTAAVILRLAGNFYDQAPTDIPPYSYQLADYDTHRGTNRINEFAQKYTEPFLKTCNDLVGTAGFVGVGMQEITVEPYGWQDRHSNSKHPFHSPAAWKMIQGSSCIHPIYWLGDLLGFIFKLKEAGLPREQIISHLVNEVLRAEPLKPIEFAFIHPGCTEIVELREHPRIDVVNQDDPTFPLEHERRERLRSYPTFVNRTRDYHPLPMLAHRHQKEGEPPSRNYPLSPALVHSGCGGENSHGDVFVIETGANGKRRTVVTCSQCRMRHVIPELREGAPTYGQLRYLLTQPLT